MRILFSFNLATLQIWFSVNNWIWYSNGYFDEYSIKSYQIEWTICNTIIGLSLIILTSIVILGGLKRISRVSAKLVPFMVGVGSGGQVCKSKNEKGQAGKGRAGHGPSKPFDEFPQIVGA